MVEGTGKSGLVISAARMRALDERAVREFGIPVLTLMENAGKAVAEATLRWLGPKASSSRVVIVCGRGNNGGDGLVAARYLIGRTTAVRVFMAAPEGKPYGHEVAENLKRLGAAGVSPLFVEAASATLDDALAEADCVLDAVLGTGFTGEPRGAARVLIETMARCGKAVVAVDLPSGMDADTGRAQGPCVKAALTLTLGLAKTGLLKPAAKERVGELRVLEIGFPKALLEQEGTHD